MEIGASGPPGKQAGEQALEQRLQLLLHQLPCMLWTTDLALLITSLDGAALVHVGLTRNQTVGLHLAEVTGPESAHSVLAAHESALRGGSATYELTWTDRRYAATVEPLRNESGEIVGTVGIAVDVTERSQAEEERRQLLSLLEIERAHLAAVLERLPVGVIFAEAPTGRLTLFNARAEEILRQPFRQTQSFSEYDQLSRAFRIPGGSPLEPEKWPLSRAVLTGEATSDEPLGIIRPDGTPAIVSISAAPVLSTERGRVGAVVVFDDITQQTLEEADRRFLANLGVALSKAGDEHGILAATAQAAVASGLAACALWSVDDNAALGELVFVLQRGEAGQQVHRAPGGTSSVETARALREVIEAGAAQLLEGSLAERMRGLVARTPLLELLQGAKASDVALVPIVVRGRPQALALIIRGEQGSWTTPWSIWLSGTLSKMVGASMERERLLQETRQAVRVRDEFLSVASHELRTPLTTVKLQLELLGRVLKEATPIQVRERLERLADTLSRQADRLSTLVGNLLDVTRLGAGRWKGDLKQVDLVEVVQRAIDEQAAAQEQSGSKVHLHTHGPILGSWDVLGLHQVASNLLSNALKYGRGRRIDVTAKKAPPWAVLRVEDQGIGIEREALHRIFGRFERGAAAGSYGGLGLGLFIVHQIVGAHGGRVRVTSDVGVGTTFEVELPLPGES